MLFDSQGWLDVATEIDYSANSMSRQGYSIKYLVLHGTAGGTSAEGVGKFFQGTVGGSNPVSSHIIIDQQGNVVQGIPLSLAAFGNGVITNGHASYLPDPSINPNWYTASIEFVKASTDNSDPLTDIQAQVGFEVIKCICDTYNIPKRAGDANGGVIKHADIDPINRARCPGTFDWNGLWNYLQQPQEGTTMSIDLTNGTVASHFSGTDNTMWQCKDNGFIVGHAILDFYRSFGGTALCGLSFLGLPTSGEQGVGHPGIVYQRFERGILAYDAGHVLDTPPGAEKSAVYLMHIDSGIGQDPRIAQLQSQITDLQGQITALQAQLAGNTLAQENAALLAKIAQAVKDLQ